MQIKNLDIAGTTTPVSYTERGEGRPFLVLHGGGGPQTVTGFADLLAAERPAHVITPIHPGFGGTARPEAFTTIGQLARLHIALLDRCQPVGGVPSGREASMASGLVPPLCVPPPPVTMSPASHAGVAPAKSP